MTIGIFYALAGAAIAMSAGIGSAIGVSRAGQASAALLSKDPKKRCMYVADFTENEIKKLKMFLY